MGELAQSTTPGDLAQDCGGGGKKSDDCFWFFGVPSRERWKASTFCGGAVVGAGSHYEGCVAHKGRGAL